jgi:excisionase family DNA binding protein
MKNTAPIVDSQNEMDAILTVQNVAEYLRLHPSTIYRLVKTKRLPAFKIGSDWHFNRESIDRWRADDERNQGPINHSSRR